MSAFPQSIVSENLAIHLAGEGTIQLEKHLRELKRRRAELYLQFEGAALEPPPVLVIARNELELPEDN